ncbi:hypothetical protein [Actinomyces sp. HMSC065F11]|uniref:hypothetical protein n=1 Tax=Actinomyces sp. HMSC065F11 TaxID=1739395 RepID=UPI0008A30DD4|nr:hypothetical protein [Actinomyces sp. HMSC065F11]OFR30547.1 hypothetical protein HMPREF2891_05860 [Actinomyces sp. HMSC065F11]
MRTIYVGEGVHLKAEIKRGCLTVVMEARKTETVLDRFGRITSRTESGQELLSDQFIPRVEWPRFIDGAYPNPDQTRLHDEMQEVINDYVTGVVTAMLDKLGVSPMGFDWRVTSKNVVEIKAFSGSRALRALLRDALLEGGHELDESTVKAGLKFFKDFQSLSAFEEITSDPRAVWQYVIR